MPIDRYFFVATNWNQRLYTPLLSQSLPPPAFNDDSDIDLAIFWDKDKLDGFDEDVRLMGLRRDIDLRIESYSFAKSDFDETNPFIKAVLDGERIV